MSKGRGRPRRGVSQSQRRECFRKERCCQVSLMILVECGGLSPMKGVEECWEVGRGAGGMLDVAGRRDKNMGSREGILERPEPGELLMGRESCRHTVKKGASW